MLALREFFWGPWPPPLPPDPPPCGDITVVSTFVVAAPLSVPQSNEPGLPVCITKFVVGVKEN